MAWHVSALYWLVHAAAGGFVFLAVGCVAVHRCRQPARRIRIIELTLVGSLLVPWVGQLDWLPHWSAPWMNLESASTRVVPHLRAPTSVPDSEQSRALADGAMSPPSEDRRHSKALYGPIFDAAGLPAPMEPAHSPTTFETSRVIVTAYACLASALAIWWLMGAVHLLWLCRGTRPAPQSIADLLRTIAGPSGDRVRLLISDRVPLPLTFTGWLPVIVLPAKLCQPGERTALRFCLAHEWSHVERGDAWRWYLAGLAQCWFFYQPLFWWLRRQLRLSQDYLADARAAEQCPEPEDYASYLVGLARQRLHVLETALSIGDRHSNLYRRILMLLHNREPLEQRCVTLWTFAASVVALVLLVACSAVRLEAGSVFTNEKNSAAEQTPKQPAKDEAKGERLEYSGQVTDKDTGKPIAGAVVTVRRSLYGDPNVKREEAVLQETKHTTDAAGKYSFVIPPQQSAKRYLYIELDVEHPDYAPRKHFGYGLGLIRKNEKTGGRPFFEQVELRPGKAITGSISTPAGEPASGIKVLAYSVTNKRGDHFEYGSFADCRTDAQGRFRLVLTTPGTAVFWILPEQYVPSTHGVKDNKRGDLGTFTLQDGIRLRGIVLDAKGQPLPKVNVNAESMERSEELQSLMVADNMNRSAVTNDKGEFEMAPLPPGSYQIKPDEHARDGSKDDRSRHAVPAVFVAQKITLKDAVEPVEIRAVPHVTIEAQYVNSKGEPTRGHECFVSGQMNKMFWNTTVPRDPNGKIVAQIPHGLENVQIQLMTNEHGAMRFRTTKGGPLSNGRDIRLGTVNDDVRGIEIVHYVAPILIINAVNKDSHQVKNFQTQVNYLSGKSPKDPNSSFVNGVQGDVYLEKQEDGRWRTSQLLPDEEINVTAHADGYQPRSEKLKLAEATTKELQLVLEKASEKKQAKK